MTTSSQLRASLVTQGLNIREEDPLLVEHLVVDTGSDVQASSVTPSVWGDFLNGIYDGASNLVNLLPTGTFLAFTAVAPIVTDNGTCDSPSELWRSAGITVFFAIFCFFSCFTDSFLAADGQVYCGIVSFGGLWTPQLPDALRPEEKEMQKYKLSFMDLVNAILSLAVFAACALMTPNIRSCLFPNLDDKYVQTVPGIVSFVVSMIFTSLPSERHGIGFPLSPATLTSGIEEATGTV